MNYITYLHQSIQPIAPPLSLVPRAPQADTVAAPVVMASRFLGTRLVWKPNGTSYVQERWSHAIFTVTGYYVRIEDGNRSYIVNSNQVRIVDKKDAA